MDNYGFKTPSPTLALRRHTAGEQDKTDQNEKVCAVAVHIQVSQLMV
jgi:hypothetical protein